MASSGCRSQCFHSPVLGESIAVQQHNNPLLNQKVSCFIYSYIKPGFDVCRYEASAPTRARQECWDQTPGQLCGPGAKDPSYQQQDLAFVQALSSYYCSRTGLIGMSFNNEPTVRRCRLMHPRHGGREHCLAYSPCSCLQLWHCLLFKMCAHSLCRTRQSARQRRSSRLRLTGLLLAPLYETVWQTACTTARIHAI